MKKVRQVYIERVMDSWLVKYVHRTYGQRYTAGQFCAKDHDLEKVKEWVRSKKNLELVEEIEEKKLLIVLLPAESIKLLKSCIKGENLMTYEK